MAFENDGRRKGMGSGRHLEGVVAATRRIIELERAPVSGIHLEMYVNIHRTDDEALGCFEFTGRAALYVVQ